MSPHPSAHTHLRKARKGQADGVIGWARGGETMMAMFRATCYPAGDAFLHNVKSVYTVRKEFYPGTLS